MNGLFGGLFSKSPKERRIRPRLKPRAGTTVLVVDDSRTVVYAIKAMLAQSGYATLEAGDAEQAIQIAKQYRPHVILMDVVLPGMNGFQATRILSRDTDTSAIPIIVMSGNQQATERNWVLKIGARDFMTKPFDRRTLFEKIERGLYQSRVA